MELYFKCPNCSRDLRVSNETGDRKIRCPDCGHVFSQQERSSASASDGGMSFSDPVTEPSSQTKNVMLINDETADVNPLRSPGEASKWSDSSGRAMARDPGWYSVRTGLKITQVSLGIGVLGLSLLLIGIMAMMTSRGMAPPRFLVVLMMWGGLCLWGLMISMLTGWFVCTAVPRQSMANGYINGSVTCVCLALGVLLIMTVISPLLFGSRGGSTQVAEKLIPWIMTMLYLASLATFSLFLSAISRCFNDANLMGRSTAFVIFQLVNGVWLTLLIFVLDVSSSQSGPLVALGTMLGWIVSFVWLMTMTARVKNTVEINLVRRR